MAIITISRGSYSRGKEVAEKLASKLNYECVSREIILETCLKPIELMKSFEVVPAVVQINLLSPVC